MPLRVQSVGKAARAEERMTLSTRQPLRHRLVFPTQLLNRSSPTANSGTPGTCAPFPSRSLNDPAPEPSAPSHSRISEKAEEPRVPIACWLSPRPRETQCASAACKGVGLAEWRSVSLRASLSPITDLGLQPSGIGGASRGNASFKGFTGCLGQSAAWL